MDKQQKADLSSKVAVVAGATRGAGRGMALGLGAAGATVYCTGRSTREQQSDMKRAETIDETAELVTARGGKGIAVQVDHTDEAQVKALFERVRSEQNGQLDILINDVWGGERFIDWSKHFWEMDVSNIVKLLERAVASHMITSRYGVPLMVERGKGLVIEITDGDSPNYRGHLLYDLVKSSVIRLAYGMCEELKPKGITALALTPGFLRSEEMLDGFGVTEASWRDGITRDPYFAGSETPYYIGQAVIALAADPNVMEKAGKAWSTWTLVDEYGFTDADGSQPHWGRFFAEKQKQDKAQAQ
jgi:NAD(P)-dependent dehydrogenase (short-subunit alcohol dehydrogenase family)